MAPDSKPSETLGGGASQPAGQAAAPAAPSKSSAIVEAWFHEQLQAIQELRATEVYNPLRAAVTDLINRLG